MTNFNGFIIVEKKNGRTTFRYSPVFEEGNIRRADEKVTYAIFDSVSGTLGELAETVGDRPLASNEFIVAVIDDFEYVVDKDIRKVFTSIRGHPHRRKVKLYLVTGLPMAYSYTIS